MNTPTVTVTMLGPSGSGKSTFMLGMYATLAGGHQGYFVEAAHDEHLQLMDAWDLLYDDGELPPPTPEQPRPYQFHFLRGIQPLLHIEWIDYRGGALSDRGETPDTAALVERLAASDSVYLVLDGPTVATWIRAKVDAEVSGQPMPDLGRLRRKLQVQNMTAMLLRAIGAREEQGKRPPSLVVVITKMDTLTEITRLSEADAIALMRTHLEELLPVAHAEGVSTLLQAVQLGVFGAQPTVKVDADQVAPRDLEKPFIFTFLEYLTNQIEEENQILEAVRQRHASTQLQHEAVSRRFGARIFRGNQLGQLDAAQQQLLLEAQNKQQTLETMRGQAERLGHDLRDTWIVRSGNVVNHGRRL
jgi:hypothetical protein